MESQIFINVYQFRKEMSETKRGNLYIVIIQP